MENSKQVKIKRSDEYYTSPEEVKEIQKSVDFKGLKLYAPCDSANSAFNLLGLSKRTKDDFCSHSFRGFTIVTNPPFSLILPFYFKCMKEANSFFIIAPLTILTNKSVANDLISGKISVRQCPIKYRRYREPDGHLKAINSIWVTNLKIKAISKPKPKLRTMKLLKIKGTSYLNFNLTSNFMASPYKIGAVPISAVVGTYSDHLKLIGFIHGVTLSDGTNKFPRFIVKKV